MNNIPVTQLQIASLVEELLSSREGFVAFDCGNFLSKNHIIVLLNAACDDDESLLLNNSHLTFFFFLHLNGIYCTF